MPNNELGAVIMVGQAGETPQEQLMNRAWRASTLDLIMTLMRQGVGRIIVAAPDTNWLRDMHVPVILSDDPPGVPFHFGGRLAALIEEHNLDPVLYFGGGSAPLVDDSAAEMAIGITLQAHGTGHTTETSIPSHIALTNNLHSSDWIAISRAHDALPIIRDTNRDNALAWLLKESGRYEVRALSGLRPATSMDLDTPTDLALIAPHPGIMPYLRAVTQESALASVRVRDLIEVMQQEAKTLAIFGRVSPPAWQALNKVSRIWTRVVAEERGMVASERDIRGQVRSVLLPWLDARGCRGFFDDLAGMADAVLFDNRVLWAARGLQPSAADRFASDLMLSDAVGDPWLREFTEAARCAPIPVVMGGHSVVSGGLHVLVEIIQNAPRGG